MATIKDISKITGVSSSTISRVLNLDETITVSISTKKKIFEAAEKLSYTKHIKPKKDIEHILSFGLVHWYNEYQEMNDPYFISIRIGIEDECKSNNINLTKIYNDDNQDNALINNKFDGLIILGKFDADRINDFKQYCDNIVFVHSNNPKFTYDSVQADFRELTNDVIKYLLSAGHEKIGFIGGREEIPRNHEKIIDYRETQFENYLKRIGLYRPEYVKIGNFSHKDGYELMKELINENKNHLPTATFIASDSMAIGAIRAINEAGLKIPEDISIFSCNDIPTSQYTSPPLSTVKIYTEFMGQTSIKLLLDQINGTRQHFIRVTVPHELIFRESVSELPKETS